MSDLVTRIGEFVARLLSGGTLEIVLLIVLIVVAVILFLVALWILWKLLVLLGKGLLWLFRTGGDLAKRRTAAKREARLAAPPPVATAWGSSPRIRLRKALGEAHKRAGPDALRVVVVAGDGMSELCRSLGLTPPAVGTIGIAADGDAIMIDASKADLRRLRALAGALPWRRPVDGAAVLVDTNGIPGETLVRASAFARAAGLRVTLHFVISSASRTAAWRIVDPNNREGAGLSTQLAQDAARIWLAGGEREGLNQLSLVPATNLATALDRAVAAAPASAVDIASLCLGGPGLRSAVAQTAARTRPADAPGISMWLGLGALVVGLGLAGLVAVRAVDAADDLRSAVATAAREAATPWLAADIDAVPSGSRVRRVAGVSARLAGFSDLSLLTPLEPLVPNHGAPARLGGTLLEAYVLRPLALALDHRARRTLVPTDDPPTWIGDAQLVGEWLAAWEGLAADPREVDLRRLLADGFGGGLESWPEGLDLALVRTAALPPDPSRGGLDVDGLMELARRNFITTMQRWAESVYTNGPVALAARSAIDRSQGWREQHRALIELRTALQDPGQVWLTAAEDRPDYGFELRMLGRALALSVLGQASALEAKAAVSRVRIDAREAAEYFILPEVGPLMVRSSTGSRGGGGGPSLSLSSEARAWLAFLDRVGSAGFADLPRTRGTVIAGPVTIDAAAVTATLDKIRSYDRFAADLPVDLPPAVAGGLLLEVANELVVGVAASSELALRPAVNFGLAAEDAGRTARLTPALDALGEIEAWLRARRAEGEADRILNVRSRVAESALAAGAIVLAGEDPLGMHLDPTADARALVRRFDRGVERLRRLYERFAAPYLTAAAFGGSEITYQWRDIGEDLAGFDRGDTDAALSGLEGMLRAYAEDPEAACAAPRATLAAARADYVARAFERSRAQVDQACANLTAARTRVLYAGLKQFFSRNVAWMWPYSKDANAPEMPSSTLGEFIARLEEAPETFAGLDGAFVEVFRESAAFWDRDEDGSPILRFRIDWRGRPGEERLAEHLIGIGFEGVEVDEAGVHTWRYGTPAVLRLRLAKNSPYRFPNPADSAGLQFEVGEDSNGAILRIFEGLVNGAFEVETMVIDADGTRQPLRLTARVADVAGAPMTLPRFDRYPASGVSPD